MKRNASYWHDNSGVRVSFYGRVLSNKYLAYIWLYYSVIQLSLYRSCIRSHITTNLKGSFNSLCICKTYRRYPRSHILHAGQNKSASLGDCMLKDWVIVLVYLYLQSIFDNETAPECLIICPENMRFFDITKFPKVWKCQFCCKLYMSCP